MSDEAEALASSLDTSGGSAWAELHDDLTSRTTLRRTLGGQEADFALSELKNLQRKADGQVRKAAFEAKLELLEQNKVAFAAALNSIKGQVNELCERQGWASALEVSLVSNNITQASLTAMQTACQKAFVTFGVI